MVHGPASADEIRRPREERLRCAVRAGRGRYVRRPPLAMDHVKSMANLQWWLADQLRTEQVSDMLWTPATLRTEVSAGSSSSTCGGEVPYERPTTRLSKEPHKKNGAELPPQQPQQGQRRRYWATQSASHVGIVFASAAADAHFANYVRGYNDRRAIRELSARMRRSPSACQWVDRFHEQCSWG
eukprot:2941599-Pyramimonas_sp.AAC.1